MTSLQALAVAVAISLLLSTVLFGAIARPLRSMLVRACPTTESVDFWSRFTIIMLYLSPLFVAVAFGLPAAAQLQALESGELIQRLVTAALVGGFFAMLAMGFWVSALARRVPTPVGPRAVNDVWRDKAG